MDKSPIFMTEVPSGHYSSDSRGYLVHTLPPGEPDIATRCGLWICKYRIEQMTRACPVERPRLFEHFSISHMLRGNGFFWTPESGYRRMKPGQAVIVLPGQVHNFGSDDGPYLEDSISFHGLIADRMRASGVVSSGIFDLGKGRRLLPILELAGSPSERAQIQANFALQTLLFEIWQDQTIRQQSKYTTVDALLHELKRDISRWWATEEMAMFCGLRPSRFREVFREMTGMAPKAYVDRLKMGEACRQLEGQATNVSAVAERLGYRDPFHFSRRFKAIVGCSPKAYQLQNRAYREPPVP